MGQMLAATERHPPGPDKKDRLRHVTEPAATLAAMMPATQPTLICRKDIAAMVGVSVVTVTRNELRWGLKTARRDLNRRSVRYLRRLAVPILQGHGFI
jgi:hypothetical protein